MPITAQATARESTTLPDDMIRAALTGALRGKFKGARLLVLIPDHTRTLPLSFLFRTLVHILRDAARLDFMVALGTHPPLSEAALCNLVGITPEERTSTYAHIGLLNHAWDDPAALANIGTISQDEVKAIAGEAWHPSLGGDIPLWINRAALDCDHLLIIGPTFPHEVVGFSGGAKYLFPGISGAAFIHVSHWLGALITVLDTIGIADTPVRALIHAAASRLTTPATLVSMVVVSDGDKPDGLAGLFVGDLDEAWRAAANLSSQRHIQWVNRPFQRVLSHAPPMYDELWTAAKAMYKLEPAIADGGEVVVYAPHLATISHVHGRNIEQAGYHVRDFYLKQWETYGKLPLGVLAHGTHLCGSGSYENGVEHARIRVTLSSQITREHCERLSLGYLDPAAVRPEEWQGREAEGILYVPKAGETLYRVRPPVSTGA